MVAIVDCRQSCIEDCCRAMKSAAARHSTSILAVLVVEELARQVEIDDAPDAVAEFFLDQLRKPAKSRCKPDIARCGGIFADSLREIL